MKCCTVMASTAAKYDRWDVGFYVGKAEEAETQLANATRMLERASKAVCNAAAMVAEEKKRTDVYVAL